jgi:hypothetical protein
MKRSLRILLLMAVAFLLLTSVLFLKYYCPSAGFAFSREQREFHLLKNRMTFPNQSDFDNEVTLERLLQPEEDSRRWTNSRAGRLEGFVVAAASARPEAANCYVPCNRDTHINIALRRDAPAREQVVLEITPRLEAWAARQGWDWSAENVNRQLLGHRVYFEGWLFFDSNHAPESENTAPARPDNWRATAWELHPVTFFRVVQ